MFKVGDRVRVLCAKSTPEYEGDVRRVARIEANLLYVDGIPIGWLLEMLDKNPGQYLELIESPLTKETMSIKEAFVLALTSEPKKSFRKAGITNGDDLLTEDGQKIFLTWLLHTKHSDEFKTGVVDGLLADQEKKN